MAERNDIEVASLKIKLGGEKKDLTIEQARKLYEALGELFGSKDVRVTKEYVYWPSQYSGIVYKTLPTSTWWVSTTSGNKAYLSAEVK